MSRHHHRSFLGSIGHGIREFFRFWFHFFFIDQRTGNPSHTKFFSIVGYIIWCWAFPYTVIHGDKATATLWLVFGAVVLGNRTLQNLFTARAGPISVSATGVWNSNNKKGDVPTNNNSGTTAYNTVSTNITDIPAPSYGPPRE